MAHEIHTSDFSETELHLFLIEYNQTIKSKSTARVLMLLLPLSGAGRFYVGDITTGLLQLFTIPVGYIFGVVAGPILFSQAGAWALIVSGLTGLAGFIAAGFAAGTWWVIDIFRIGTRVEQVNSDNAKRIATTIRLRRRSTKTDTSVRQTEREMNPPQPVSPKSAQETLREPGANAVSRWKANAHEASNRKRSIQPITREPHLRTRKVVAFALLAVLLGALPLYWYAQQKTATRQVAQRTPMGIPAAQPQLADVQVALKRSATDYFESLVKKDFRRTTQYLSAPAIQKLGGDESAVASLRQENATNSLQSFRLIRHMVIKIDDLHYVGVIAVSTKGMRQNELTGHTERVRVEGGLLAYSKNGGKEWTFTSTSTEDQKYVRQEMGAAVEKLTIPPQRVQVEKRQD